jgi:hypothetical protein
VPSPNWEGMIPNYFRSKILGDSVITSSSVAIPRNVLKEMNGFLVGAKWGEDLDLWGRIALKYPIGFSTSCHAIIHVTGESLMKIHSRVSVTSENPFIKSAETVIKGEQSFFIDRDYLMLYLDKITIQSARYNANIGQKSESKTILRKCRTKAFFFTKISLNIWYGIPEDITKRSNGIGHNCLLFIISCSHFLDLRILRFLMTCREIRGIKH